MNRPPEKTTGLSSTETYLKNKVSEYIKRCIECNRCMESCPATKEAFSIHDLNMVTQGEQPVPLNIKEFTFHCTQCGKCVPVCPKDIRRDHMMRYLKYKIRDHKPWGYTRYLFIKGSQKNGIKKITQQFFIRYKKFTNRDLSSYMETIPDLKADVLFYPGCYLYSTRTMRQTLRLLNHVGHSYTVLGGVTACCGAPHLLQGEFEQADECMESLYKKIRTCNPRIILTACAECFETIETIKKTYQLEFEVLSVAQYLLRFKDKFPARKIRGTIMVHDSCRFPAHSPQGVAAHQVVSQFSEHVTHPTNQPSSCCYQWNHGSDPYNTVRQASYLAAVKHHAPTLACNCLTCYEELKKAYTDVEVIDVLQLFEEALDATEPGEQKL